MPDYNINQTIGSIWTISRVFFDIFIMWIVIYYAIKFVRNNSRTIQIFKGIIVILIVNGLAKLFGFNTVAYFSDLFINWGFMAVVVIFQPEIRGLLERLGKTNAFSSIGTLLSNEKERLVEELHETVIILSKARVGALISIEQSQSMQDYIRTGIEIKASVSKELLCSIFMTTTPLHDGAVIIQGDQIACASAYFPPTNANLSSRYGARHRAALGIAEVSDALTIVVSEETSAISIAEKGKIFSVDESQLKDYLRRVICNDEIEIRKHTKERSSLLILDSPEMIVDKEEERPNGFFSNIFASRHHEEKTPKTKKELDMKLPTNHHSKQMKSDETVKKDETVIDDGVLEIKDNTNIDQKEGGSEYEG